MEDLHKLWGHRWLTPKAKPFQSKMHGIGIIAIAPIAKGDIVQVVGGIVVPRSQISKCRRKIGHIGIQIQDDFWLVPANRTELEGYGAPNHSCAPNIGFSSSNIYIAIRNINQKEEICVDYAFMESDFQQFNCNCKSTNCRKIIKPDDWKNPELQKKYGEYFSPYLKKKF